MNKLLQSLMLDVAVKLRMDDYFDTTLYNQIVEELKKDVPTWKDNGFIPCGDVITIIDLLDILDGNNRFLDEKTSIMVEDANLYIKELLYDII